AVAPRTGARIGRHLNRARRTARADHTYCARRRTFRGVRRPAAGELERMPPATREAAPRTATMPVRIVSAVEVGQSNARTGRSLAHGGERRRDVFVVARQIGDEPRRLVGAQAAPVLAQVERK